MKKVSLLLNNEQINRLFPFFILINENLIIDDCGSSLQKFCGNCTNQKFLHQFSVINSTINITDFCQLKSICNESVILNTCTQPTDTLNGQFEFLSNTNQLLFIGTPQLNSFKQVAENKLQQTQEIALFHIQTPDPLLRIKSNGSIAIKNPAAEKITSFFYQGKNYSSVAFWKMAIDKKNYINNKWTCEVVANNKTYLFICHYLPNENYYNIFGRDITIQKKNEEHLLRLSVVASANENGVLFTQLDGKITWINEGFCKQMGLPFEEIIGKTLIEICDGPLTDKIIIKCISDAFYKGESFKVELKIYRKNGSYFWSKIKGQSYKTTGNPDIQFFTIIEDITIEKEKEKQLKILSQIAETNINPVIITNEKGCITWINKSYIDISGYQQNEVIGKNLVNLLQGPNANQQTIDYIKKQILKGQPFSAEIYNHSKSGNEYWLRINGQPIYNTSGKLTGFFALEEDITKEKENQKRLKASELKFWIALEKIYENAWEHDFTTGKTSFSKSNNDFWGYTNNELTDNVDLWLESIYKDDAHLITDNYAKYLTKEIDSHNLEYRIVHKNGTVKWVMDRGVVIERSADGKPLRTIGTHTDITQTKLTETELDRRIKQFKSLSENIPGVIYEYEFREDGSEGLRYISPAIERVFGIKPNDFHNYLNYIHPDDRSRILQKNDYCKKTLKPFYDESILTVPGVGTKWHAVYSSFSYISQTGAKVFTGFMMDITERKNAEDILRTNEEKYRSIIANMKLGLMEVDNDSNIIYTNNSFCDMSGYSLKELLGNKATTLFTSAQNVALLDEKKEKRNKGIADAYQIDIIDKNKNIKWWLISSAASYSNIGVKIGSIGIYLDITEQKKLELELIEARVQAEQLAKTKEVFLANMSHEIRTPMNAIIGMSNQLGKTSLEPQQKFYLDTVHSAADNLLVIINDILDLSKIEAGKLSLENVGFEPKTLLSKAIQVLAYRAEEKGLELINSHFDHGISNILIGDHYRLNQVLLNLISNAVKFTEKGTIDLVFKLLKNDSTSQTIQVEVSDTGIGMDQSFVKQLFDKFSQEYKSISRRYGGTGLGMSICKQLIELMGGSITAKSKKGEGTTISFIIKFKKGTKKDLPKKETIQVSEDFLTGKKILVVDDNDMNRLVASIILQNYGAEIIEAINGEQAIEKVAQQKCDVVLMDIQMPGINGFDATRIIRKTNNNIPIIALTANAIKGESEKCIESGMNDYIPKPFKEEELLKTIAKWLGKKVSLIKNKSNNSITNNTQLYSLAKLTTISNGNNAFVQKMIQIFCDQTPLMLKEMMEAYNAKNWVKVGSTAHKMKPIIDNLDIYILKETIRNIEAVSEDTKEDKNLPKMLKEVTTVINKVIHIMRQEYKLPLNDVAIDSKF